MLQIFIEDTLADLAPRSEVEIVIHNAFFKRKASQKDYSYTVYIAATDRIREKLEYPEVRQTKLKKKIWEITVVFGNISRKGTLKITNYDEQEYEGFMYLSAFSLGSIEIPLNELDRPLEGTLDFQWTLGITQQWPNTPLFFPSIINKEFYDSQEDQNQENADVKRPLFDGLLNSYNSGFLNNYINPDGRAINAYAAVPMPALLEVMKMGIEAAGYTMAGEVLEDERLAKAWMFNNRALDYREDGAFFVFAERPSIQNIDLDSGERINFTSKSTALDIIDLATDTYTLTYNGIIRVKITLFYDATVYANNLVVRVYKNGVLWKTGPATNSSADNYSYEFEANVNNMAGQEIYFTMANDSFSGNANIQNVRAEFEMIDGEPLLVKWKAPENMKDYLPAVKFGDFFNAVCDAFNLVPLPDERNRVVRLNFRSSVYRLKSRVDIGDKPNESKNGEISPITDNIMIRYKKPSGTEQKGTYGTDEWDKVAIYNGQNWILYEKEPDDFEGEKKEIGLTPLFVRGRTYFFTGFLSTIRFDYPGWVEAEELENALDSIYIGFFEGVNGQGQCPADFITNGLDLRLNDSDDSVLKAHKDWINFKDARSRKEKRIFHEITEFPDDETEVIFMKQRWLWEEMRIVYSPGKMPTVELVLM